MSTIIMDHSIEFGPITRFRRLLALDRRDITQVYVYALFNGLVNLSLPLGIQAIVNLIQGGTMTTSWTILVFLVIAGIALAGLLQLLQLRIVENLAQKIFAHASFEFAYRIPKIQYSSFRNYYGPELANRFFDTMTIQKGLPKILIDFSLALFQIIVGLLVLSLYHPFFIIFSIILVIIVYLIIKFTGKKGLTSSINESSAKYRIAFWLEEIARSKLSFKLASDSDLNLSNTNKHVDSYLDAREKHFKILIKQSLYLILFKVLVGVGLLITGSILVFNEQMNIGQFVAAEIIIILIIASVEKLIRSLDVIYDVLTGLEKIGFVFDKPLDKSDGLLLKKTEDSFAIAVDQLSHTYDDSNTESLKNISFSVPKNESLLITGPSSSGKSTLLRFISGIMQAEQGIIKYNDLPIQSLDFESIKQDIGFSLSNVEIFHGTILENISLNRPRATPENITDAIKIAGLNKYLSTTPMGLRKILDPEGRKVPRNIQNRILLARAIATKPRLLILEDPLDHVKRSEKKEILELLSHEDHPWKIIVTSVDDLWKDYIKHELVIENGEIISSTLKS